MLWDENNPCQVYVLFAGAGERRHEYACQRLPAAKAVEQRGGRPTVLTRVCQPARAG